MRTFGARPGPFTWALLAVMAGIVISVAAAQPDQALAAVGSLLLFEVIVWAGAHGIRVEITDSVVRVKQGWFRPEQQAARSDITAIHFSSGRVSFRGPDQKPIMTVIPDWSLRQMLAVADELACMASGISPRRC